MFKFVKKKIVLDCFTFSEGVIATSPVTHATKHLPEWWRKLPPSYVADGNFFPTPTMKQCAGMIDYYKNSIALPLWSEMHIQVDPTGCRWQFSDKESEVVYHDIDNQARGFLSNHIHIKIVSPWLFKTKESVSWVWSQPMYSFYKDSINLKILPGVLDFSKQCFANINLLVPSSNHAIYVLPHNQIMAHITPMSDRQVEVVRHLISHDEYTSMRTSGTIRSFINAYKVTNDAAQKFGDCPFKREHK